MLNKGITLSKRTKMLLIALVAVIVIGAGYLAYDKILEKSNGDNLLANNRTGNVVGSSIPSFKDEIFNNPKLLMMKRDKFKGFTNQSTAIVLDKSVPLPPREVEVSNPGLGNTLVISWKLPLYINFGKVRVYRSNYPGEKGKVVYEKDVSASEANKLLSFQDFNLEDGNSYYYLVATVQNDGDEAESYPFADIGKSQIMGQPTDTTPPAPPANVRAQAQADGSIRVSWINPSDSDLDRIIIYRSSQPDSLGTVVYGTESGQIGTAGGSDASRYFDDIDVESNITYYYTVVSRDDNGNESTKDLLAAPSKPYFYNPFEPIEF